MCGVELFAVEMALERAEQSNCKRIVIWGDSVSALTSLKTGAAKIHQNLLLEIMFMFTRMARQGGHVMSVWVPAHLYILGNERADKLAKEAVKTESVKVKVIKVSDSALATELRY